MTKIIYWISEVDGTTLEDETNQTKKPSAFLEYKINGNNLNHSLFKKPGIVRLSLHNLIGNMNNFFRFLLPEFKELLLKPTLTIAQYIVLKLEFD